MRKYRVLHLIDHLGLGGAQEVVLSLVRHADRQRFEPEVATLYGRGPYAERIAALGVPVHSLSPGKLVPLYVPALYRLCRGGGFDALVSHLDASLVLGNALGRLAGIPERIVYTQCDPERLRRRRGYRFCRRHLQPWASHVVVVCAKVREYVVAHEGIPAERVSLVHNCIDPARFESVPGLRERVRTEWGILPEAPVVCSAGRLTYQKNFEAFLRIAARVAEDLPELRVLLAGGGPDESDLKRLAGQLGLAERVRFLGYLADATGLYAASDVFLLTSRYETTPLVVLEAMAARLPVVTTPVGSVAETFEDGTEAFFVPDGDEALAASRVAMLLRDREQAARVADAAHRKVCETCTAPVMTRQFERLLSERFEGRPT